MPYEATKVTVEVDGRRMRLSSLEKVMYPRTGTTKAAGARLLRAHRAGDPAAPARPRGHADPLPARGR